MNKTQDAKCKRIFDHFGLEHQYGKAVEELSELNEAIVQRPSTGIRPIISELADVLIMCRQLEIGIGSFIVDLEIESKLDRTLERIESGYYK